MVIDWKDKPYVIGVAGGSASGKTTVSNDIFQELNKQVLSGYIISIDDFYISVNNEEKKDIENINFDDPKRIDFSKLEKTLISIINRKTTTSPIYDFKTCTCVGEKELNCNSIDFVIIEGLFCLYDEKIRNILDVSIFIEISDEVRLKRRILRDIKERGAEKDNLIQYYNKYVKPSYNEYILPTKEYAGKIITEWNNETFTNIINWLSYNSTISHTEYE
jgi:uridine kinase